MNRTKIDWADRTWNPVTGCFNDCTYCYARKIANRFKGVSNKLIDEKVQFIELYEPIVKSKGEIIPFPFNFIPTFHRYRLRQPQNAIKPQNIFVCSMADLFGNWIPDSWIEKVFAAAEKAPQHNYLFLTKNIHAYEDFKIIEKDNYWYGQTFDCDKTGLTYYSDLSANTFISIEPILSDKLPLDPISKKWFDWVIVGAETGNRKGKVIPKKEWIMSIAEKCKVAEVPIFMKESLKELMGEDFIQEWPSGLKHE